MKRAKPQIRREGQTKTTRGLDMCTPQAVRQPLAMDEGGCLERFWNSAAPSVRGQPPRHPHEGHVYHLPLRIHQHHNHHVILMRDTALSSFLSWISFLCFLCFLPLLSSLAFFFPSPVSSFFLLSVFRSWPVLCDSNRSFSLGHAVGFSCCEGTCKTVTARCQAGAQHSHQPS